MATFTWKLGTSLDPKIVLREEQGCLVLASYETEEGQPVLLTLPLSCLTDLAVAVLPSGSVDLEEKTVTFTDSYFKDGMD